MIWHALSIATGIAIAAAAFAAYVNWPRFSSRTKSWWESGLTEAPSSIEYRDREGVKTGRPLRASGLHLVVENPTGMRLVSAGEAVDRDKFWQAWKYLGGKANGWIDEDGDEWRPE